MFIRRPRLAVMSMLLCCICVVDGKKRISDLNRLPVRVADAAWTPNRKEPADEPEYERTVRWWLQQGGNIDARCPSRIDITVLLAAVLNDHQGVVNLLLERGADPNAPDGYGYTPLMQAARSSHRGNEFILQALLDAGADVQARQETQPFSARDPAAREDKGGYDEARRDILGATALHHAALTGRVSIVKALLAAGASTLARDEKGRTAVEYASSENVRKTMLEHREDEESAITDDVCTAQHAIYYDNTRPAMRWVRDGRDVDARCMFQDEGSTLLQAAARKGNDNLARWLLRHGASVNARCTKYSETALHAVISPNGPESRMDTLRTLISWREVDLNAQSHNGTTALIAAACRNLQGMAQELLLAGADASLMDHSGKDAYAQAVAHGSERTASYLAEFALESRAPPTHDQALYDLERQRYALHVRAHAGATMTDAIAKADDEGLDKLASIHETRADGWTKPLSALHIAAYQGHVRIARQLLSAGADVNTREGAGYTPLMLAAIKGQAEVARLLIEHRALVDVQCKRYGLSALVIALRHEQFEVAPLLVDAGADLELRGKTRGSTALMASVEGPNGGNLRATRLLLAAGASVDAVDDNGATALMSALSWGNEDPAKLLVDAGADVLLQDSKGWCAVQYALAHGEDRQDLFKLVTESLSLEATTREAVRASKSPEMPQFEVVQGPASGFAGRLYSSSPGVEKKARQGSSGVLLVVSTLVLGCGLPLLLLKKEALIAYFAGVPGDGAPEDEANGNGRGRRGRRTRRSKAPEATDQPQWWRDLLEFHEELRIAAKADRPHFIDETFTHEIMRNPAMLISNREVLDTYEHDSIDKWFERMGKTTNPSTGAEIDRKTREVLVDKKRRKEIRDWCEEKAAEWRQNMASGSLPRPHIAPTSVHIFIDHSNAIIGATRAGRQLNARLLSNYVERGRVVKQRVLVGSHETERARDEWERLGYEVSADPRKGKEHFVDEALQSQLMKTACQSFEPPRVIALVTGDGNANSGRTTFPDCVVAALRHEWQVEIHSWRQSISNVYITMAEQYADQLRIRFLDDM